jgi:chitosanase
MQPWREQRKWRKHMISEQHKRLVMRVVNVFETGTPEGKYDALVVMADGKNKSRQITYGRSQTTEQGSLKELVRLYIAKAGAHANALSEYVDRIGVVPLADDATFKNLLKQAGSDPVMRATQDQFFEDRFYRRALEFFDTNRFTMPLSLLVIYDSYIHSGSIPDFLRARFPEKVPARGGGEKEWIKAYVDTRHEWLRTHSNELLPKTVYRTQCFKDQISADNWDLSTLPISANRVNVS